MLKRAGALALAAILAVLAATRGVSGGLAIVETTVVREG
jgi:hypothetical protein